VFQFDAQDAPPTVNYWVFPVSFFAPHQAYSSRQDPVARQRVSKTWSRRSTVQAFELILDVVFNHTAEGDHRGPTLSFRGFENDAYYILEQTGPGSQTTAVTATRSTPISDRSAA